MNPYIPLITEILRWLNSRRYRKSNKEVPVQETAIIKQFTRDDILMGRLSWEDLPIEHRHNVTVLLDRLNRIAVRIPFKIRINDGYRRPQDQPRNAAVRSRHLSGEAVDIDDDDTAYVWKWIINNLDEVARIGFWLEDPRWTHGSVGTWVHLQTVPPASGRRIFIPNGSPASAPELWTGDYDPKLNHNLTEVT